MRYSFGPWTFDPSRCLLLADNVELELDPLSFKLLSYFITQGQKIVSREELVEQVWQQKFVDDNAINRAISDLRKQLKTKDYKAQVIKTHYRKGYSFQLDVTELTSKQVNKEGTPQQSEYSAQVVTNTVADLEKAEEIQSQNLTPLQKPTNKKKTYLFLRLAALLLLISAIVYFSSTLIPTVETTPTAAVSPIKIKAKPQTITAPSNTEVTKTNSKPLKYSEEILSWEKGSFVLPVMSTDNKLLAYTFMLTSSQVKTHGKTLRVKDMVTLKEYNIAEQNEFFDSDAMEDYFPITWFDEHILVYQITNAMYDSHTLKCEVWQVSLQGSFKKSAHEKLFDCFTDEVINADIANDNNQLLYTKYNYRGIVDLSAIVSRNLTTGKEFQVSSPNKDERGDYFVKLSNNEDRMLFLREQPSGSQIFIADIDGSNQKQLLEVDYYISTINWDDSDTSIFWINSTNKSLVSYDLKTKQLKQEEINSDYNLGILFRTDLLSKNNFILATINHKTSIDKIDLSADKPTLTEFIDSDKNEHLFVPFNHSAASIYLVVGKGNNNSIWHYEEGVRRKLLDIKSTARIRSLAISPDDNQLLIATNNQLYIYDLNSLTRTEAIDFSGAIKKASWPQDDNILLTYAPSLKTYAWFYNVGNNKLTKLSDLPINQAKLIHDDYLLFLSKDFKLIKKNINTGESNVVMQFEKMSGILWDADENYIYYLDFFKKDFITKKSLTNKDVVEYIPVALEKSPFELVINNTEGSSTLFVSYSQFKPNYLIEMKLKTTTDEDRLQLN